MIILSTVFKVFIVVTINLMLFLIIPASKDIFNQDNETHKKNSPAQRRIVAEVIKKKKEKKIVHKETKTRKIHTGGSKSFQQQLSLKLAPDLGIVGSVEGVALQQEDVKTEVFSGDEVDQIAVPLFQPQPQFPESAKKKSVSGSVAVTFIIDTKGKISSFESIRSPDEGFVHEIRKTLLQWKFKPAKRRGVPVKQKTSVEIDFSYKG